MRMSRLSWQKQKMLIALLMAGSTTRTAALLTEVNKSAASWYFHHLRLLIYQQSEHLEILDSQLEVDEVTYVEGAMENTAEVPKVKSRYNESR